MLVLFLSGEFLFHIPYTIHFYVGSFSYTSHAGCIFMLGGFVTHPILSWFLCKEFLWDIPCWLLLLLFIFIFYFLSGEFLLYIPCWLTLFYRGSFIFIQGVSLTHPMITSFLSGEYLLHIPCWLHSYLGHLFYASRAGFNMISVLCLTHFLAGFIFIGVVSLTHPMMASFLCGEFLLHIPCWLHFYLAIFSYTSHAGFTFLWGVSLTHPMLAFFFFYNLRSFSYTSRSGFNFYLGSFS